MWFDRSLTPQPQDGSKATYTSPIAKEDGIINWQMSAEEISRRVRAFYPWPGCYTWWQGKLLKLLEAVPLPKDKDLLPGKVVALAPGQPAVVGVETGDGILGPVACSTRREACSNGGGVLVGTEDFCGEHFRQQKLMLSCRLLS